MLDCEQLGGGALEGLDWLGRVPGPEAPLLYRFLCTVARIALFGVFRLKWADKPFALRLFEMLVLYLLLIGIAHALEAMAGNAFPQGWQFYTVTLCLMLVLAFPQGIEDHPGCGVRFPGAWRSLNREDPCLHLSGNATGSVGGCLADTR